MQGSARIDELRQKFHENPRRYFAPLANEYRKAGDPEQAIAICRAHLAQQPGHMSGHVVYAQALYDAKRTDEARAVFEKALELDPDNAIVLRQLGDISREKGETDEAKHWYSRALDADPQDREVAAYLAELTEPLTPTPPEEVPAVAASPAEEVNDVAAPPEEENAAVAEEAEAPEVEVPLPEPAREPEVAPVEFAPEAEPAAETPATADEAHPPEEGSPWRKTPPHEESPFVTRTMADLYAKQGYRDAALDVYRQLALQHPDDREISDRIEELELSEKTAATSEAATQGAEPEEAGEAERPSVEAEAPEAQPEAAAPAGDAFPEIVPLITDAPVEAEPESFAKLEHYSPYAPSAEDLNLAEESGEADSEAGVHFTERELPQSGDSWDTSSWGAGFSGDDDVTLDFETPDQAATSPEPAAETQPVGEAEAEPAPEAAPPQEPEAAAPSEPEPAAPSEPEAQTQSEPEAEAPEAEAPEPTVEAALPAEEAPAPDMVAIEPETPAQAEPAGQPVIEPLEAIPSAERAPEAAEPAVVDEPFAAEESFAAEEPLAAEEPQPVEERSFAEEEPAAESEEPAEEPQFVAYSPQLPEEKDLPHFAPKGPTVREFFAALGAYRPPAREGSSITAHAAVSRMAPPEGDYPLATDAFANLFAESEVSDEDSRAAFALSGAISASAPAPEPPEAASSTPAPAEQVASPAQSQESEEDIRKFREWLDGLTES